MRQRSEPPTEAAVANDRPETRLVLYGRKRSRTGWLAVAVKMRFGSTAPLSMADEPCFWPLRVVSCRMGT